ncbi:MAG: hypothetical protein J6K53_10435 [Roseburia sp.]|nr:hypothetical protein [Roseburia sp.]
MKNVVMVIVSALIGVLTLAIVMTVGGRTNRSMEIKSNLPSAVEETVENLAEKNYTINDRNAYIAYMAEGLMKTLDTDSDIRIEVLAADKEKAIMSIRVTEEFKHPNGREGTTECERTVILNKVDQPEPESYKVRFYVGNVLYKSCVVLEGDLISAPVTPQGVAGWTDANGYLADFSQPVTQELTYYAEMN